MDGIVFNLGVAGPIMLPFLVFLARIVDVSLGTLRTVLIARGVRWLAPLIGFVEVLIWITVVAQIVRQVGHWGTYIAYAAGFACGTWVGMLIEERIALGTALVRVIPQIDADALAARLRSEGFGVTAVNAQGMQGPVQVLFTVVRRGDLRRVLDLVRSYNSRAFVTVEDVRDIRQGYLRVHRG